MIRRVLIALVVFLGAASLAYVLYDRLRVPSKPGAPVESDLQAESGPPNVVLLIIDTLRSDLLGCYGCSEDLSPEIDELAREGVVFEDVLAQCSWTRPSIGSMVTGLYPRTIGIYKETYDVLAEEHLTLAEILRDNGYNTLGITANPNINTVFGFGQGFDEYSESMVLFSWMQPEDGKIVQKAGKFADLPKSKEVFDWVLRKAQSAEEGPTYVQINIMEVHTPELVRREFMDLGTQYAEKYVLLDRELGKGRHIVWKTYLAVRQVSYDVGVFVRRLTSLPGWGNTLFVITSDHGQGLADHPNVHDSLHHGNLLYGSQLEVPLILYNPSPASGLPAGRRIDSRARLLDVMPTVLDYTGVPAPSGLDGASVLSVTTGNGPGPALPPVFVAETNWRNVNKIAAYGDTWKYIENRDGWRGVNPYELQRIGGPENGSLTDQIGAYPEVVEGLRRALEAWEARFAMTEAIQPAGEPSEREVEQLKSLGYIE
jgi:arylsulfatase A-like enzyme